MRHDTTMQRGIEAGLKAMAQMIAKAGRETSEAYGYIRQNEQNMAIGAVVTVEDALEQSLVLYRAVLAMHRFKSKP